MDWAQIHTWPNSDLSRRGQGPVHRWHIQETGTGKTLLMLHGAGGSTHSYAALIPLLAQTHHVVALDLPGTKALPSLAHAIAADLIRWPKTLPSYVIRKAGSRMSLLVIRQAQPLL